MRAGPLVLTYHAIATGPAPLCVEPALLAQHLDCIVESGARVLTMSQLATALGDGVVPDHAVVLTFDDGFANAATEAAPLLAARGMTATVFCVSGHLGGLNDWPSQPATAPRLPLADMTALQSLAAGGWEIGGHGVSHRPLGGATAATTRAELVGSRRALEEATGTPVTSFAWPYGSVPMDAPAMLGEAGYTAACTTRIALVRPDTSPLVLPRVDAHYLRRPAVLAAVLAGHLPGYLPARRVLATARRRVTADHLTPPEHE